jgi:NAD(P)-dependent dehydrogenase (short-subunit alcohol dehydrogenase family)
MDLGLKGKVALITGASKGLGRAIAEELTTEGVHVSICARRQEDLAKAAAGLRRQGSPVVATQADVTELQDVQHVIDQTICGLFIGLFPIQVSDCVTSFAGNRVGRLNLQSPEMLIFWTVQRVPSLEK